jgi:hypothetical protein
LHNYFLHYHTIVTSTFTYTANSRRWGESEKLHGNYQLQIGEPYFMPEVGLGIGRNQAVIAGIQQEFLCWYDHRGNRYLTDAEQA